MKLRCKLITAIGVILMTTVGYKWATYLNLLHENATWFSNVDLLNKEISFRTEAGLYYSYFKEFVEAPSISSGLHNLIYDNITEHGKTINIFNRFNIHQEVFGGLLYRITGTTIEPINFYTKYVFALQGIALSGLYLISWAMTGSWMAGFLSAAYVVCHRRDVTRVEYTVGLREHFSLPFMFVNLALSGRYLAGRSPFSSIWTLLSIYLLSVTFTATWQFAQFFLLLESLVLFGLGTFNILNKVKVCKLMLLQSLTICSVWFLQYYQPMVISSLVFSFIPIGVLSLRFDSTRPTRTTSFVKYVGVHVLKITSVLISSLIINIGIKYVLDLNDDNHILHFIKSKFGFSDVTNFETQLYLCLSAFQAYPLDQLLNICYSGIFPLYLLSLSVSILSIGLTIFSDYHTGIAKKSDKDSKYWIETIRDLKYTSFLVKASDDCEVHFHHCMSIVLGALALSTYRMKCFWLPYVVVCGSSFICNSHILNFFLRVKETKPYFLEIIRHAILILVVLGLYSSYSPSLYSELEDLRELHDPDTVALMDWINNSTPKTAAFTGSMQLLAAVKLSTKRPVTNHPHFEDKDLRHRTKELFSIYSKKSVEDIHSILLKYNSSYIILEDSICMAPSENRCSLKDTMDLTNGIVPDDGIKNLPHLKHTSNPRFCDEIRYEKGNYGKLFKRVFANRTFRVYKVRSEEEIKNLNLPIK